MTAESVSSSAIVSFAEMAVVGISSSATPSFWREKIFMKYFFLCLLLVSQLATSLQAAQTNFQSSEIAKIGQKELKEFYALVKNFSATWFSGVPSEFRKDFTPKDLALLFATSKLGNFSGNEKNFVIDSWYLQSEELQNSLKSFWTWAQSKQARNKTNKTNLEELKSWLHFLLLVNHKILERPVPQNLQKQPKPNNYLTQQHLEELATIQAPSVKLWQYNRNLDQEQILFFEGALLSQSPHNLYLKSRYYGRLKKHYQRLLRTKQFEDALHFGGQLAKLNPSSRLYQELSSIALKQKDRQLQEYFLKQSLSVKFTSGSFFKLVKIMLQKGQQLEAEELLLSEEKRLVLQQEDKDKFLSLLMQTLVQTKPDAFASQFENLQKKHGFSGKLKKQAAREFLKKAKQEFREQKYFVAQTYTQRSLAMASSLAALELEKKIGEELGFVEVRIEALLAEYLSGKDTKPLQKALDKDPTESLQLIRKKPRIQARILKDALHGKLEPALETQIRQNLLLRLAQIPSRNRQINLLVVDYWKKHILSRKDDKYNLGSGLINIQLAYRLESARNLYKNLRPYSKNIPVTLVENLLDGINPSQALRHASLLHDYALQVENIPGKSIPLLLAYTRQARETTALLKLLDTRSNNPRMLSSNESEELNQLTFASEDWTKTEEQHQALAFYLEPLKAQKAEEQRQKAEEAEKKKKQAEQQRLAALEQQKIRTQQRETRRKQRQEAIKRNEERKKQEEEKRRQEAEQQRLAELEQEKIRAQKLKERRKQFEARKKARQQAKNSQQTPKSSKSSSQDKNKTIPKSIDEKLALLQSKGREQNSLKESTQKIASEQGGIELNAYQQELLLKAIVDFEEGDLSNARQSYIELFQILTEEAKEIPAKVSQKIKETSFVDTVENFAGVFEAESYWQKLIPFLQGSQYLAIYQSYIHTEAAIRFEKAGQFDTALSEYQVAINSYVRNKIALESLLGFAQAKNNTQLEFYALKRLERFFGSQQDYSPAIAEASFALANYYWKIGQIEEAKYYIKESLDLKPDYPKAQNLYDKIAQN